MCTGAMILFGIKRCVMGENETFVGKRRRSFRRCLISLLRLKNFFCAGGEAILHDHGQSRLTVKSLCLRIASLTLTNHVQASKL